MDGWRAWFSVCVVLVKEQIRIVTVDLHRSCWHEISEQMDRDRTFGGIKKKKKVNGLRKRWLIKKKKKG